MNDYSISYPKAAKMPGDEEKNPPCHRDFVRLLAEHERRLTAYIHALIPLWQDAEDVLQNTKLRLWEQFDSFRPDGDFGAWAIAIAYYMVQAHRTLRQRERVSFSDRLLETLSQDFPARPYGDENRISALMECIEALNSASRRLLRLAISGKKRIKDIATDLGQAPSTTRMALLRIRRSLFECVEKRLHKEGKQ